MDAHLALEAEAQRGAGRGFEPLLVRQIDPNRVERRLDAGGARRGDDPGAGIGQLRLVAAPRHVHVEREITGAEGDTPDAGAGREDRVEVGEATRRLDDRDQIDRARRQPLLAFELRQQPVDRGERGGAFDLWQDDAVEPGPDDRDQVAVAELGVDRIDANIEERSARARQRRDDRIARRRLLGGRDRVLEVEDDRVGIERQRLLDAPRMIARRKQKTA